MTRYFFPYHMKTGERGRGKAERQEETGNCRVLPRIFYTEL